MKTAATTSSTSTTYMKFYILYHNYSYFVYHAFLKTDKFCALRCYQIIQYLSEYWVPTKTCQQISLIKSLKNSMTKRVYNEISYLFSESFDKISDFF